MNQLVKVFEPGVGVLILEIATHGEHDVVLKGTKLSPIAPKSG
jgi:hypothetical protein